MDRTGHFHNSSDSYKCFWLQCFVWPQHLCSSRLSTQHLVSPVSWDNELTNYYWTLSVLTTWPADLCSNKKTPFPWACIAAGWKLPGGSPDHLLDSLRCGVVKCTSWNDKSTNVDYFLLKHGRWGHRSFSQFYFSNQARDQTALF